MTDFSFDDIAIGHRVEGPRVSVTRAMIKEFAEASFDHNPLHWDDDYLESTRFAGARKFDDVIGHGLMTYAFMTRAMTDWLWPGNGDHRRLETRFRKPVYPGDDIAVDVVVTDKRATAQAKWLVCALTVRNQHGAVVATGEAMAELLR